MLIMSRVSDNSVHVCTRIRDSNSDVAIVTILRKANLIPKNCYKRINVLKSPQMYCAGQPFQRASFCPASNRPWSGTLTSWSQTSQMTRVPRQRLSALSRARCALLIDSAISLAFLLLWLIETEWSLQNTVFAYSGDVGSNYLTNSLCLSPSLFHIFEASSKANNIS